MNIRSAGKRSLSPSPAGCGTRRGPRSPACASAGMPSGLIVPTRRRDRSIESSRRIGSSRWRGATITRRRLSKSRLIGPSTTRPCEPIGRRDGEAPRPSRCRRGVGLASGTVVRARKTPLVASLSHLNVDELRLQWRNHLGGIPPAHLPAWLFIRVLPYRIQAAGLGDLDRATVRRLAGLLRLSMDRARQAD